ncbi:uncharacterized protein [Montipora capricornis]|uniref:uncharacterized protein n=1 Tax=Montipora capricornis TaxID=246305 RepID=UPI0035F120E8
MANNRFMSFAISSQRQDGLNVKSISLDSNLVPSKVEESKLVPSQAMQLIEKYAPRTKSFIDKLRRANRAKVARGRRLDTSIQIVPALGSKETIYSIGDCGLFAAVLTAYNNHWILRTSPDDWWFCVIKRVAFAIDENAKKRSVRKMFVDHQGKKAIEVEVPEDNIYTVDYSWFFDQIAKGVKENIKVPEFVDGMTADFSTTTAVQKMVSQITLMNSVQEYFNYEVMMGCGIPAVEMVGTENDWSKLKSKLKVLRELLEPIENDLDLPSEWWDVVEKVFSNLLATYQGGAVSEWWSHIMSYENVYASGVYFVPGEYRYRGWMTEFLEGEKHAMDIERMTSGLVSAPLTLKHPSGVEDTAAVVGGMLGFTVHTDDTNEVSVQPFQCWSLLLSEDSPFRQHADS